MQLFEHTISWLPWLEALLVGLLLMISMIQPKTVALSMRTIMSPIQRRYVSGENNPALWICRSLFQLGVVSLSLLVAMMAYAGCNQEVSPMQYGKMVVVIAGVMLAKAIVDRWIQLTFKYALNAKVYYSFRSDLWMIMSVLLLVTLLINPWMGDGMRWGIPLLVFGTYIIVLWWKLMQVFGWNIEHIGYTLIYIAHVEILPVMVAVVLGDR